MNWIFLVLIFLNFHYVVRSQQDWNEMSLMDIINATEQLSEVRKSIYNVEMLRSISNLEFIALFLTVRL